MADRRVQVERELLKISGEINDLKKKGAALTEAELKLLQKKRLEERSLKKEQAKHYKEQEENLIRQSGLTSKLEQLQDKIGKIYKHNNKLVVETNAEFYKSGLHLTKNLTLTGSISDSIIKSVRPLEMVVEQLYNAADASKQAEAALEGVQDKSEDMSAGFEVYKKEVGVGGKKLKEWVRENADGTKTVGMAWQDASKLFTVKPDTKTMKEFESWANRISEDFNVANQAGATMMETLADGLTTNAGNAIALQENFLSLGGPNFTNMTSEMEKQAKITEYQVAGLKQQRGQQQDRIKGLTEQMRGVDKTSTLYKTMNEQKEKLQKQVTKIAKTEGELTETAETNLKLAREQAIASDQITGATEAILAPFEKIKGLIESMPMGGLISKTIGLEQHMGEFGSTVSDAMSGFLDGSLDVGGAMDMIKGGSGKMIQGLSSGLKMVTKGAWQFVTAALANPYVAVAAAIALIGVLLYKAMTYAEAMRQEFGVMRGDAFEIQTAVDATAMNFKLLGVSAEDVGTMAQGIADSMGGVSNITQENLATMADLQGLYGMSADSIAPAMTAMKGLGAESNEAASAQLAQIGHMAQMEGVAPAKVFADMTADMGTFSRFGKEGGKNLAEAAIMARKLGTSLESMAATSDALLDFESNINDQMEASMLLGRSINMDKARELALAGDVAGQEREILKQIGTQAQWQKLNVVQRDALAKATGKSTQDLSTMLANQANLNSMTAEERANKEAMQKSDEKANEGMKAAGKSMGDAWSAIMAPLKEVMMAVQPLLGLLMKIIGFALKPIVFQFKLIGFVIKPIIKVLGFVLGIITDIVKWVEDGIMSVFGDMGGIVSDIGGQIYSFLLVPFEMLFGVAKSIFSVILSVGKAIFSVLVLPFKLLWEGVKLGFSLITSFGKAIFGVGQSIFNALITPFKMLWDGIKAGFAMWVGLIKAPFNLIIAGVNMVINAINSLSVKVPDWVPFIGGKEFGFNLPTVPSLATEPGGPGHNVKESGVAEVHKGESVGTFDMSQTNSKLDELIQLLGQSGPIAVGVGGVKSNTKSISDQIL